MTRLATFALSFLAAAALPAAEWVNISDSVTSQVKPGYAGPTAGVTVNPANGDVFMVVNDQGLWRSSDRGATFARVDDKNIGGRCETGWALNFDPAGQRLFCFMIYGSSAMTTDGGKTWAKSKVSHLDYGSVDWGDTGKRVLAIRHESGGMLTTSDDGGATWKDLEKGFNNCGVLDRNTFVATKAKEKGIFRSTDAGATWAKVSESTPVAATPVVLRSASPGDDEIRPSESLLISLLDVPKPLLDKAVVVDGNGSVNLPFIGPVPAAGRTLKEFEKQAQAAYVDKHFFQKITVAVKRGGRIAPTAYWCNGADVLVSKDKGATWTGHDRDKTYSLIYGPFFGAEEKHFVVVGKSGFYETKDGGNTWQMAAPLPPGFTANRVGPNYAWDAKNNIFYASTMTKPTFKYQR